MTKGETSSMLTLLKTAYPNFYRNMTAKEAMATLDLWSAMFERDEVSIVKFALYKLIETHKGFPPDVASVKEKIRELVAAATGEPTDEQLWQILKRAVSNGYYGAREEYEKLPPVLQRYLGSPNTLRELATVDVEIFNTVTHGQFLKQIGVIRERQEYADALPAAVKETVARLYRRVDELPETSAMTEAEFHDARNRVLDQLEGKHRRTGEKS